MMVDSREMSRAPRFTDFSIDAIMGNSPSSASQQGSPSPLSASHGSAAVNLIKREQHLNEAAMVDVVTDNTNFTKDSKRPRPKRYQCPYCWVALSNTGQFRGHIRIHTGERPFKCDHPYCQKTFTRNEELTRHKRIHTGQRPYACPLCNKCFGRKDHLKKHTRTHEKQQSRENNSTSSAHSTNNINTSKTPSDLGSPIQWAALLCNTNRVLCQ